MNEELYKTMRDIGKEFCATSRDVGKWLKNQGLRLENGEPSPEAKRDGWIKKVDSTHPGTYSYRWNYRKVKELFEIMGYRGDLAVNPQKPVLEEYTVKHNGSLFYQVLDADGQEICQTFDQARAFEIAQLYNTRP